MAEDDLANVIVSHKAADPAAPTAGPAAGTRNAASRIAVGDCTTRIISCQSADSVLARKAAIINITARYCSIAYIANQRANIISFSRINIRVYQAQVLYFCTCPVNMPEKSYGLVIRPAQTGRVAGKV